jgi:hypothetical protein
MKRYEMREAYLFMLMKVFDGEGEGVGISP